MAKFLNTSGTTYHLEALIKHARDRVILISPYLKFNDRIKELIEDKNRMKIDVRMVYGKTELQPAEMNWLRSLTYVRTSYCRNLHAKCYLNEDSCIISSLNLYDFSQVNNNEMGILLCRHDDERVFADAYEEALRIIRISDEVRTSAEIINVEMAQGNGDAGRSTPDEDKTEKLTTSKLANRLGIKTQEVLIRAEQKGWLEKNDDQYRVSEAGMAAGVTFHKSKHGWYFLFPQDVAM